MNSDEQDRAEMMFVGEAANELRVSETTIRRAISSGQLPALRLGERGRLRVRTGDVHALLQPAEPRP